MFGRTSAARRTGIRRRIPRVILTLAVALTIFATSVFGVGTWQIGIYTLLSRAASAPLAHTLQGAASLMSYSFLSWVGGVAFEAVATPTGELVGEQLVLSYNPSAPDGRRLEVKAGNANFALEYYDWILVPAAWYANSRYNACISLFGPAVSKDQYDIVYHESLQDTLLGVRVFQGDTVLMDPFEMWQLPAYNGRAVLGAGEHVPTSMNEDAVYDVFTYLLLGEYRSWLLTDVGVDVRIAVDGNSIQLSGSPYYYFWDADYAAYAEEYDRLLAVAQICRAVSDIASYNQTVRRINALEPEIEPATRTTTALKEKWDTVRLLNPAVLDATQGLMQLAAFYRYVSSTNPAGWDAFLEDLRNVTVSPQVLTPTEWDRDQDQ